jgi:ribosomal protein S6E (S10)
LGLYLNGGAPPSVDVDVDVDVDASSFPMRRPDVEKQRERERTLTKKSQCSSTQRDKERERGRKKEKYRGERISPLSQRENISEASDISTPDPRKKYYSRKAARDFSEFYRI